jgi:hypothetical protein
MVRLNKSKKHRTQGSFPKKNNPNYKHGGYLRNRICTICGKKVSKPNAKKCTKCWGKLNSGSNHYSWKGGKIYSSGYVLLNKNKKYIRQHLLVAEYCLKRKLKRYEEIHHLNGIKDDNHPRNLLVINKKYHKKFEWDMFNFILKKIDEKLLITREDFYNYIPILAKKYKAIWVGREVYGGPNYKF